MNFLLSLNKKLFIIFSLVIFFIIFILIITTYIKTSALNVNNIIINTNTADITKPKFSINSDKQKISITANEGNFLTDNEIMLKKNVIFKSNKFKIISNNVIFNKKDLIASSKDKAKFISKNALINSNGFDITENGNIINFKGRTKVILR